MNKKILKNIAIILGSLLVGAYLIFLILPFILNPLLNGMSDKVSAEIEKATGFKAQFDDFKIITTPKLSAGAKLGNAKIFQPDGVLLAELNNGKVTLSLLPLLAKNIKVDAVCADKFNLNLQVKPNGHYVIEDFFKQEENTEENAAQAEQFSLPFGLKLSNNLPDFKLKEHNISFIDTKTGKAYSLTGSNTNITDFIFNKKIKVQSEGKLTLNGYEAFVYDVKILNKIMPETDLNDLFTQDVQETPKNAEEFEFNIINAFETIKNSGLRGALKADLTIDGNLDAPELNGELLLDKVSMLSKGKALPDSDLKVLFKKNTLQINSNINTALSENTQINGKVKTGKSPDIDLTCKSNATLKSIFEIADTMAQIFGVNDLKTLSATGQLDVNFNIKSDLKKITSNGHLKLPSGNVSYGLYGVNINDIVSDIKFDNNNILINKLGFSTFSIPFNITGKINQDATCGIKVQTSSMPLKGLLVSLGQASILKENPVTSGALSLLLNVTGRLDAPKVAGNISLVNLNLKNIPSDIKLSLNPLNIDLKTTNTGFSGTASVKNISAVNPAVTVSVPVVRATLDENNITISDTDAALGKNQATISGVVSNYLTDKIGLDFVTKGKIPSNLTGDINPYKMLLNLKYSIPNSAEIVIPGFDKSKLLTNGALNITGNMANPVLKGQFNVKSVEIPEIPVSISNMLVNLDGPILAGNATVQQFASGGIAGSEIKSDFKLLNNVFYLKNLQGSAFDGSFNGDIAYNLASTKCDVKLKGANMSALKAIEGAAGIKNALTGTLGFDSDLSFKGVDYNDMMKSLKGAATFEIKNGVLANLGGLKNILNAQNIIQNSILKTSATSASKLSVVQSASEFDYINGSLNFSNAYAILNSVKMSGPLMAYYVTGKFHLLNGTVQALVLGKLAESVTGSLGNIGNLAVTKLSSAIPGFGVLSSIIVKNMNESPKDYAVSQIPSLRSSDTKFKNFKVEYNGGVDSSSSVKSFKWLNDVDTSALDAQNSAVADVQKTVNEQINQTKANIQNSVNEAKEKANQAKQDIIQTKEQAKDMLKTLFTAPSQSAN